MSKFKPKYDAFAQRRYKTLVDVLATTVDDASLRELCRLWDVEPVNGTNYLDACATIRNLAKHVQRHFHEQTREE